MEEKNEKCTCGGRGWEMRYSGKDTQFRTCPECWEASDQQRRDAIKADLADYRRRTWHVEFPSGRMA